MSNDKVVLSNMSIEVKTEEVVKRETNTDGTILREAIAHTLEDYGFYHYTSEPCVDVDHGDDYVNIDLCRDAIDVDDMIDAHFVVELIKRIDKIKEKNDE